ncbi:MAG: DUF6599 family protein [Terriglobia bacterium]
MFFILLFSVLPLAAAQKSVVIPLIPASKWELAASAKLPLQALEQYGDQIPVDQEFGVRLATRRIYQLRDIQATAIFEEAADTSSAFGLYTFYQSQGMKHPSGIQMAMANGAEAIMARGRYFIRILRPASPALPENDFRALLITIGGARLSVENLQSLPGLLPAQGMIPGTEKYLLGDATAHIVLPSIPVNLIGFDQGAEAEVGMYRSGGMRLSLLAISYPTPQIAVLRFKPLKQALQLNQDHGRGSIYGRKQGSYALLVLNAPSRNAATRLLDQFKVSESLTWSPQYKGKQSIAYQLLTLLIANGELILIIAVLAIIGGILIFLTKRLILRYFPNSTLVPPEGEELISLKLTSGKYLT